MIFELMADARPRPKRQVAARQMRAGGGGDVMSNRCEWMHCGGAHVAAWFWVLCIGL